MKDVTVVIGPGGIGKVMTKGGAGVVISSQSGYRMPALAAHSMDPEGGFITDSDFLIDGGTTANFFYGSDAKIA